VETKEKQQRMQPNKKKQKVKEVQKRKRNRRKNKKNKGVNNKKRKNVTNKRNKVAKRNLIMFSIIFGSRDLIILLSLFV
jgi:hypothetical protein